MAEGPRWARTDLLDWCGLWVVARALGRADGDVAIDAGAVSVGAEDVVVLGAADHAMLSICQGAWFRHARTLPRPLSRAL